MKKMLTLACLLSAFVAMPVLAHDMDDASSHDGYGSVMADHMIHKMDTNGDGKISRAEHAAAAAKMFDEADTNHDGYLTKQEIIAYQMKHRKDMHRWHHGMDDRGMNDGMHHGMSDCRDDGQLNDYTNPHPSYDR